MKEQGLVPSYTVAQFKPQKAPCNESIQANELKREFQQTEAKKVVVSDLTIRQSQKQMVLYMYLC